MTPTGSTVTQRLTARALPLALAVGMVVLLHQVALDHALTRAQSATLALGFLLVGGFVGGKAAAAIGLPRITGYLLAGVLVGPHLSGLLTKEMLAAGKAVEGLAVALIALTAGGELRLPWVKKHAKRLAVITFCELWTVAAVITGVMLVGSSLFPFVPEDLATAAVIAMVFGTIAVANSPTVTIAVIAETRSEGPVARTALGVTILKDVAIIILFAIALAVAKDALGAASGGSLGMTLLRELGGSVVAGLVFGVAIGLFLRFIGRDVAVFVLGICFAMWQTATALHLETLLVALTAGFWVENFSRAKGEDLIKGIERLSLPVYALFFAAAGTKVDLGALQTLWPLALMLTAARGLAVWAGTRLGTQLVGAEPEVKRYLWLGFISQAGVSLALATIVARTFPAWGDEVQALIVAMIAIHELIGPIGFQWALSRAGEVGRASDAPGHAPADADPEPNTG